MQSASRPASWSKGRRSSVTHPLVQVTSCQSQRADGVNESQPFITPSESWRLSLKEVSNPISVTTLVLRAAQAKGGVESTLRCGGGRGGGVGRCRHRETLAEKAERDTGGRGGRLEEASWRKRLGRRHHHF
ncbi:Aldo_ket_red domain-containing protein [Psidium guajava]|nr:Aldo_ket_red domain-containing protein [Psidium guajava]